MKETGVTSFWLLRNYNLKFMKRCRNQTLHQDSPIVYICPMFSFLSVYLPMCILKSFESKIRDKSLYP